MADNRPAWRKNAWELIEHGRTECANLECPNKLTQGQFMLVRTSSRDVVGGFRGITLLMCVPCAHAFEDLGTSVEWPEDENPTSVKRKPC